MDRFPRPDLAVWMVYKPEAGQAKGAPVISSTDNPGQLEEKMNTSSIFTGTILVPEQIATFMAALPRKEGYNGISRLILGPVINTVELLAVIFKMPIPVLKTPKYVPAPLGYAVERNAGRAKRGRWD